MTRFRVLRHPLVARDISRIAGFLLEHATPRSVAEKIAVLDEGAGSLTENPYRGTRRDEIAPGLRAIPSAGKGGDRVRGPGGRPHGPNPVDNVGRIQLAREGSWTALDIVGIPG